MLTARDTGENRENQISTVREGVFRVSQTTLTHIAALVQRDIQFREKVEAMRNEKEANNGA